MGVSSFLHPSALIYSGGFPSWFSWTRVCNTSEACGAAAMQCLSDEKQRCPVPSELLNSSLLSSCLWLQAFNVAEVLCWDCPVPQQTYPHALPGRVDVSHAGAATGSWAQHMVCGH